MAEIAKWAEATNRSEARAEGDEVSAAGNDSGLPIDALNSSQDGDTGSNTFDNYRSVADPSLMIFVKSNAVPPFRFKAGGWDLLQSSIDLGPAMKARVAEKGFFLCRTNNDQAGWAEETDLLGLKTKAK